MTALPLLQRVFADRVASHYAEDAIAYPPSEPVAVGRAAAKKVWASHFAEPGFSISWKTLHAEVSTSGEVGFTAGTYEDSYKEPDGKKVIEKGKYLCTWIKQSDGTWKAIHDIWNADAKEGVAFPRSFKTFAIVERAT